MWKWECPATQGLVFEYHSFSKASEGVHAHVFGKKLPKPFRSIKPCALPPGAHKIYDDGEPCGVPNCRIPYIHAPHVD